MQASSETASPEKAELRILRRRQVEDRLGLSCSTIYALIAANKFPKPIRVTGAQLVGWIESEINEWLRERVVASRGEEAHQNKARGEARTTGRPQHRTQVRP